MNYEQYLENLDKSKAVNLVWSTPHLDNLLAYIARVSNPANQKNKSIKGLISHMMEEGHVSPFTMANICVEVNTSRAIGRQILRHWTMAVQEFSQRYQDVTHLGEAVLTECRMQDTKNRQSSLELPEGHENAIWWEEAQRKILALTSEVYKEALDKGIAKETARAVQPEGLTPSRLYLNGNIRTWIHYLRSRLHDSTQKEHRLIAIEAAEVFRELAPVTYAAFFGDVDLEAIRKNPAFIAEPTYFNIEGIE